jgi:hypothetical protein
MTYEYPRGLRSPAAQDIVLVGAWLAFLAIIDAPAAVRASVLGAIPIVLAWGVVSLHFPSRVDIDGQGVAFARYGRIHRFPWRDVRRLSVRRFLVRDRVLITIEPSGGAWRGRYWIVDSLPGFDRIVEALEQGSPRNGGAKPGRRA